jgi:hypothetical protein
MFYDVPASMKPAPSTRRVLTIDLSHGRMFEAARYRWEFLRRNPEYCADYNEFMRCFGAWLKRKGRRWPPSEMDLANWTKSEQRYFRTKVEPVLTRLRRKWQLSDVFPPEFGLEQWRQIDESDGTGEGALFPPTRISSSIEGDVPSTDELKRMGFLGTGNVTRQYENLLLIQVDLNSPLKDLLDHTRHILRWAQGNYRRAMEANGFRLPKSRRRFDDYVLHLRIWDLKNEGKRNAEIARLVFPNLSVQSALYKVRDHLKAANKLISGHYREIS